MKIKKLITINWANLPNKEYLFGNLVFITGETGVGKSTMLDAIQTVMTGGKANLTLYNAGQDEAQNRQRNKEYRTLEGYCVGEDRFKFARPNGCTTTIAVTFHTKNRKLFTALINVKVSMEIHQGKSKPKRDHLAFFIVKGRELFLEDLIGEENNILNHKEIYRHLSSKFKLENIIKCDSMSDYLNTLYGHLWGENSTTPVFSEKAARAFSNFIHAKPVEDINKFVRKEFLERKNMTSEVENLSQIIHSLNDLKKEAKEVDEGVTALRDVDTKLKKLLDDWFSNQEEHYLYRRLEVLRQEDKIVHQQKKYDKKTKELNGFNKKLNDLKKENSSLSEALETLRTSYRGNEKLNQLEYIETNMRRSKDQFNGFLQTFFSKLREIDELYRGIKTLYLHSEKFTELCLLFEEFYTQLTRFSEIEFADILQDNSIENLSLSPLLNELDELLEDLLLHQKSLFASEKFEVEVENIAEEYRALITDVSNKEEKLETLKTEINQLEKSEFYCPPHILVFFNKLQMALPNANAKMLYEFVDLVNDEWREAIEGFIAGNRFIVLVNATYEQEAIDRVKEEKLQLKIIQGKKVLKDIERRGKSLDSDSIVKHLSITNDTVEAYLINSYGDVLCVESSEELTQTRRGVTKDAKACSNNVMFDCALKEKRYIFGKNAREETLKNLREEFNDLNNLKNRSAGQRDIFSNIVKVLESFKSKHSLFETQNIRGMLTNLTDYHQSLEVKKSIDTSDIEKITDEINTKKEALKNIEPKIEKLIGDKKVCENFLDSRENVEKEYEEELSVRLEKHKEIEERLSRLFSVRTSIGSFEEYRETLNATVTLSSEYSIPKGLKEVIVNSWNAFYQAYNNDKLLSSKAVQLSFLLQYTELIANEEQFIELHQLNRSILDEVSRIENSPLYQFKDKIAKKNEEFKSVFTRDFCQVIYMRIEQGKSYIDKLNKVLKNHTFGDEVYKIERKEGDKELKEYYEYFKTVSENNLLIDSNSLPFDEYEKETDAIADKLLELFSEKEKYNSELERIADYRNYFNYDILQIIKDEKISLTRNGKNSGGQGETSYYIIRSLNLQSALKSQDSRRDALETAIIDESFLKLNVERSKAILSYLTDTLGFQVICAMPTKQAGSFFDMPSSNYNIIHAPLGEHSNGQLDYQTFVTLNEINNQEIQKLTKKVEKTLLDQIVKEADKRYGE